MKLRPTVPAGLAVAAAIALASCSPASQAPKQPMAIAKENAKMRSEVPLARPVSLAQSGEIANVEFDVPPPGPNAAPDLMLGLRIARPDAETGAALSSNVIRGGIEASVRLLRLEGGNATPVQLMRSSPDLRDWLAVPENGHVPGVTSTSVESTMLQNAGLIDAGTFHDVLMFAGADRIVPGRYRVVIELPQAHPQFQGEDMELLVAYFKKGK